MAARSIGTGTLSFGMVSIPIRTYSAGESASAVSFNLLHGKCKSRLKQQYVCPKDNEIVAARPDGEGLRVREGPVRHLHRGGAEGDGRGGAEGHRDHRVRARLEGGPVYFDGAYYLGPDKGGEKAYKLLNEAMKQTGRVGARQVGRARQAVPRADPARRERPRDAAAPLRGRGAADLRGAGRGRGGQGRRAEARGAARRADRLRRVPARELRGRGPQALPRGDPAKVEGQEITAAPEAAEGARSSTSWRRSRPASRPRAPRPRGQAERGAAKAARLGARRRPAPRASARAPAAPRAAMPDSLARVAPRRRRLRALPAPAALVPRGGARRR